MNPANDNSESLRRATRRLALTGLLVAAIALTGCDDKKSLGKGKGAAGRPTPTQQAQAPASDPAPVSTPAPSRKTASRNALEGLELDPKVEFPKINEPSGSDIAETVAALAAAIANGDSRALHPMLDEPNQVILDELVESGAWQSSTESITKVRVCTLEEQGESIKVGLGIESADGAYLLGWSGERLGNGWLFAGIALETPADALTAVELDGGSLAARDIPEPGAIIDDTFDPTLNDPRRGDNNSRRRGGGSRGRGGGRRGLR
ncbi:MAG: hypothetical protein H6813_01055 [Phycisphaeraceae bacterium]|nr:hypothetical protein [Phycisphaeraceae bacterium]MCB9847326.1 hypothetical protein [Phycisphaeraceae bacterium]